LQHNEKNRRQKCLISNEQIWLEMETRHDNEAQNPKRNEGNSGSGAKNKKGEASSNPENH
jgi:hypothetical protein